MTVVAWDTSNLKVMYDSVNKKVCTKCCDLGGWCSEWIPDVIDVTFEPISLKAGHPCHHCCLPAQKSYELTKVVQSPPSDNYWEFVASGQDPQFLIEVRYYPHVNVSGQLYARLLWTSAWEDGECPTGGEYEQGACTIFLKDEQPVCSTVFTQGALGACAAQGSVGTVDLRI